MTSKQSRFSGGDHVLVTEDDNGLARGDWLIILEGTVPGFYTVWSKREKKTYTAVRDDYLAQND